MAGFRDRDKQHFPLDSIDSVVNLFRDHMKNNEQPNLALLSIVLGTIENALTVNRVIPSQDDISKSVEDFIFPKVELDTIEALYHKFVTQVRGSVDLTQYSSEIATRDFVKKVSDVIWNSLTRSYYKDKAHIQTLYSYLTGNKLDCFGVSYAVVAACQILGYHDVHLALSEDHAWVFFGEDGKDTAEVTWHGKGNEDKRGQPVNIGVAEKSWLYLNGYPVSCTRHMEVAAGVSAINPAISSTTDSVEMSCLQQKLLWLLYDNNYLEKYPMALGNLGDLEEICPSENRCSPEQLFTEAIESAKKFLQNQHVYPYTYLGGYYYRKGRYKDALRSWAEASSVIKNYNYNREDEEIYKEFLEIANELIPHIIKMVAIDGPHTADNCNSTQVSCKSGGVPFLRDQEVYGYLLQFYDGICQWEEGSSTPVLHVGWAKHLVHTLSKIDPVVRERVEVIAEGMEDEEDSEEEEENGHTETNSQEKAEKEGKKRQRRLSRSSRNSTDAKGAKGKSSQTNDNAKVGNDTSDHEQVNGKEQEKKGVNGKNEEDHIKTTIEELASKVGVESQSEATNPNIAALAQACGESILNPEYLLSGGEPFASQAQTTGPFVSGTETKVDVREFLSSNSNGTPFPGLTIDSMLKAESPADMLGCKGSSRPNSSLGVTGDAELESQGQMDITPLSVTLHSMKMKGLKGLLTVSGKLNASAIKLQLTAQSQVQLKHSKINSEYDFSVPRKRTRRE